MFYNMKLNIKIIEKYAYNISFKNRVTMLKANENYPFYVFWELELNIKVTEKTFIRYG